MDGMTTNTSLRQAKAKAYATGWVAEKNLKAEVENGINVINGSLTVKIDDLNTVKYNVKVAEKTKAGGINKAYEGMNTVLNEYKSIASDGIENADRVVVNGDINLYQNINNGEQVVSFKSNFFSRFKGDTEFVPRAEFVVEMFISKIIPETSVEDNDVVETGRVKVTGWVPTFNGIESITLIAGTDIAEDVADAFNPGDTVRFSGNIVNSRIERKREIPMRIGKPKLEIKYEYVNEMVIIDATEPYNEESGIKDEQPYNAEAIKLAISEREVKFNERKAKAKSGANVTQPQKPSGAAFGGRSLGF